MAHRKTATKIKRPARPTAKSASHKTKSSTNKQGGTHEARRAGEEEVIIDRRRGARRNQDQGSVVPEPSIAPTRLERRKKVNRRRQIDPTTCERDYTDDEIQFMNALEHYKRASGRMFPTCSEVLEVVRSLGYVRLSPSELAPHPSEMPSAPVAIASAVQPNTIAAASADEWQ